MPGQARKNDDPDMRHVRLTFTDGKQLEGYIPQKYMTWATEYVVVLADKPDAKKGKKHKAEKLQKMEWLTPTEEHPEGEVWERCQTIIPLPVQARQGGLPARARVSRPGSLGL